GVGGPAALGALFEISAGAEGPAGAGDDSDPDIGVRADPLQRFHERTAEFAVHGVADLSAVEGDDSHVVSQLKEQCVTVHDGPPLMDDDNTAGVLFSAYCMTCHPVWSMPSSPIQFVRAWLSQEQRSAPWVRHQCCRLAAKSNQARAQGTGRRCWTNPVTPGNTTNRPLGNRLAA